MEKAFRWAPSNRVSIVPALRWSWTWDHSWTSSLKEIPVPSLDELERLSRYEAGELPAEERQAVEAQLAEQPDLRAALAQLRALPFAASQLPLTLEEEGVETLVGGVARPQQARSRWSAWRTGAYALGALVIGVLAGSRLAPLGQPEALLAVVAGPIRVNSGPPLSAGTTQKLVLGDTIHAGRGAAILSAPGVSWLIPEGSELIWSNHPQLIAGTAVVEGVAARAQLHGVEVELTGRAVLSMEPPAGVRRVTELLADTSLEELVRTGWLKLGAFGVTMVGVGAGATVFLLDGRASAVGPSASPVHLEKGELWAEGSPKKRFASQRPDVQMAKAVPDEQGEGSAQEVAQLRGELEELKKKQHFQELVMKGLDRRIDPTMPQPWPEAMPETHQSSGLSQVLGAVKEKCPQVAAAIDRTFCEEPPCIVALHDGSGAGLLDCAPWREAYGRASSLMSSSAPCDGGAGSITLISPYWDGWENEDPAYQRVVFKRLQARWESYLQDYCR